MVLLDYLEVEVQPGKKPFEEQERSFFRQLNYKSTRLWVAFASLDVLQTARPRVYMTTSGFCVGFATKGKRQRAKVGREESEQWATSYEPASLTLRRLRVYKSTRLRVAVAWATLLLRGLTTKDKGQKSKRYRVYSKAVSFEPASPYP